MKIFKWVVYATLGAATVALVGATPFLAFWGVDGGSLAPVWLPWGVLTFLWLSAFGLITLWDLGGQE